MMGEVGNGRSVILRVEAGVWAEEEVWSSWEREEGTAVQP